MIKSEDIIKRRGDFFWFVVDFLFEKDTIGHIFTEQYYGLQYDTILSNHVNTSRLEGLSHLECKG